MKDTKKIAFVLGGMSFGGAERVISILANHYAQKGWQADILTLLKPDCDFELHPSIRHIHMGGSASSRALRAPRWLFELNGYLRREKPDCVVSFAARINLLVLGASLLSRKPRLIISERNDPMKDTRTGIVRRLTELLYPRADAIVFQTEHAKSCFSDKVQKKGLLIANPVTKGLPKAEIIEKQIAAVGKLMHQKNHALLIRAFAAIADKYPEHTVHIYGDGPLRPELEALIAELGLQGRVILEGWKSDVNNLVSKAALFVLPSDYEGLSNALMEAVAMGMPCISTDCAGAKEMIINGKSGLITPIGDEKALTEAMDTLLADPHLAAQYGAAAAEHAKAFETGNILKLWENAIECAH